MNSQLNSFTDVLCDPDEICDSQPLSLSSNESVLPDNHHINSNKLDDKHNQKQRPVKGTGQYGQFRSVEEIDEKYRSVFSYPFFNLVQSKVIDDALYTDKSMVVSAPTGSGKTVVFEMAIVQLLMEMEDNNYTDNFKIIYMAPVKALCTERLTEWYPKFTKLGLFCIEVTGDTDVDFSQLAPYKIIITTPEKWDMLTRRWRDYRRLVEQIKLFMIDEVHILNDPVRGPVLEAVVSRMKTIESSAQSAHRIEQLQKQYAGEGTCMENLPKTRFIAVSATVGNPDDVATWLGNTDRNAVYYTFGDESRPVKLRRVVEGYPCQEGTSIFKFDIMLNYKLWPIIQKYHNGKPTLIFCNTRKSVLLTAETLSREITIQFTPEQQAKLTALASTFKNKKLQSLVLSGVGCHHAGLLFEERTNIEHAFRNRDLPILITTTTLAMGVNLPAHLVIIKNTQQYVNGAYQEYSISTVLQMVGRAGRPQYDTEATAVIMTRLTDKGRYQALVGGSEPLQSYLHKRLAENLNSEAALGTVGDVAQCVQWLRSTFLFVRAARDPKRYLGLPQAAPQNQISKKIEELCVKAMNGLASTGLITMDDASCIQSTEAGRLMSIYYLDLGTMKHIMKINGTETLEQLLWIVCESHELADMHLRVDERRFLNALNRNNAAATIRFPMKGKITTRQMKVYCLIQAILGCLPISDPSLNQEAMKIMRIADRVCKCLLAYVTQPSLLSTSPKYYSAVLNSAILAKCVVSHLWEQSPYVSKQLRGIGPTFSTLLATAGKVNFMTLEESHPRDLERIMKRGAPAGNLLRKEISLLPKYQLTMTPIDEKSVTVQLDLLNCSYLMENIDNLTAGNTHKCYIIVGDSENHILLLTSFSDNTLITVYNGTITFEISRIHNFEHKISAHCISSTFAGIDANCDYIFKDLEPLPKVVNETPKRLIQKQTTITDTFKGRKRKFSDSDNTQLKEKKKRDSNIITKFQNFKESFAKTSKDIKHDLDRYSIISNTTLEDNEQYNEPNDMSREKPIENNDNNLNQILYGVTSPVIDDCENEFDEINDDKINDILNEIENEMTHGHMETKQSPNFTKSQNTSSVNLNTKVTTKPRYDTQLKRPITTQTNKKCTKNTLPVKSNYNFIDLLERNVDFNDDEEKEQNTKQSGFSLNVKQYIDKYLNQVQQQNKVPDKNLTELIETTNKNTNEVKISEHTDNSELPEYVELNKVTTLPITTEQIEIIENSPNNEDTFDHQLPKVIEIAEPNRTGKSQTQDRIQNNENFPTNMNIFDHQTPKVIEVVEPNSTGKLQTKDRIQNNADSIQLQKSYNEKNIHTNILITEQNVETCRDIPNTEISMNDKNTIIDSQKQSKCLTYAENHFVNRCNQTNDMPSNNNASYAKNVDIENVTKMLDYKKIDENSNFTKIQENSNRKFESSEDEDTNIISFQLFDKDLIVMDEEELKMKPNEIDQDKCPLVSQLIIKSKSLSLENSPQLSTEEISNIPCNKTTRNINNSFDKRQQNNQNEYVKKYSYTCGQTNVITKITNQSVVKITRKLHLNLDITEILQKNTIDKVTEDSHNINTIIDVPEEKVYYKSNVIDLPAITIDFDNYQMRKTTPQRNFSVNPRYNFGENIKEIYTKNSLPMNSSKGITDTISEQDIEVEFKENEFAKKHSNRNISKSTEENSNTTNENKDINNILNKYSKIMRKKTTVEVNNQDTIQNIKFRPIKPQTVKPKGPYKISDINKFSSQLPIIQASQQQKKTLNDNINEMKVTITKIQTPKLNVKPVDFLKQCDPIPDNDNEIHVLDQEIDEPDYYQPLEDHKINDNTEEINIDPTMFNPKTLLQCFNNEDDQEESTLLPPPPEFCDSDSNSPKVSPKQLPAELYDPKDWNDHFDLGDNSSIFQTNLDVDLTPTKEIETWTLAQDNENINAPTFRFQPPSQSFTVLNENSFNDSHYHATMNRHNKLGKFKFTKKRKLKL